MKKSSNKKDVYDKFASRLIPRRGRSMHYGRELESMLNLSREESKNIYMFVLVTPGQSRFSVTFRGTPGWSVAHTPPRLRRISGEVDDSKWKIYEDFSNRADAVKALSRSLRILAKQIAENDLEYQKILKLKNRAAKPN